MKMSDISSKHQGLLQIATDLFKWIRLEKEKGPLHEIGKYGYIW